MQQTKTTGSARAPMRADIQGLRAVAVVAVIIDHLLPFGGGGFIGVDIFFVISGYLITGLLIRDSQIGGGFSLVTFYKRRIKRIMPAASLVLVVTIGLSYLLFNIGRSTSTLIDGLWSAAFAANWHFAAIGTDYFRAEGPVSPLQHFWSLAVEEQFYLLWPTLIWIIFAASRRSSTRRSTVSAQRVLLATFASIVMISFTWSLIEGKTAPVYAYFSTFSRAWELGIGSILAVITVHFTRLSAKSSTALAWLGITAIATSFYLITDHSRFPAPWAALPVLGTALVIIAGSHDAVRHIYPLTNRFSGWLGEISYSLYLWHFPVIVLLGSAIPNTGWGYYFLSLTLIVIFAVGSYYFFERPIRGSSWLVPQASAQATHISSSGRTRPQAPLFRSPALAGVVASLCLTLVAVAIALRPTAYSSDLVPAVSTPTTSQRGATRVNDGVKLTAAQSERSEALTAASAATEWPEFRPALNKLGSNYRDETPCDLAQHQSWTFTAVEVREKCVVGSSTAKRTALVIGDSLAGAYMPSVVAAISTRGWNVVELTRSACPAIDIQIDWPTGEEYPECAQTQRLLTALVVDLRPNLIIMTNSPGSPDHLSSGSKGDRALSEWKTQLKSSLSIFAKSSPVVVLAAPPPGSNLTTCAGRLAKPRDCTSTAPKIYKDFNAAEQNTITQLNNTRIRYVPTETWFCVNSVCPSFVGTTPMFLDGFHLTASQAKSLGPLMYEALDQSMTH